jgi:hypothetical protein
MYGFDTGRRLDERSVETIQTSVDLTIHAFNAPQCMWNTLSVPVRVPLHPQLVCMGFRPFVTGNRQTFTFESFPLAFCK